MKKLFLFLSILLASTQCYAVTAVNYTAAQDTRWQAMKTANDTYYQQLSAKADTAGNFTERGQWDALMYKITGDTAYAVRAWDHVAALKNSSDQTYRGKNYYNLSGGIPHNDNVRADYVLLIIIYSWICEGDAAGADNCDNFYDILDYWLDLTLNHPYGTSVGYRLDDSDRSISSYFGSTLFAKVIEGDNPTRAAEILNWCGTMNVGSPTTIYCHGGLDADKPTGIWTGTAPSNYQRLIIKDYFERNFGGGVFAESASYNFSTVSLAIRAATALQEITGVDYYPELTGEYENLVNVLLNQLVTNKSQFFLWGVVEDSWFGSLKPISSVDLMNLLYEVTGNSGIAKLYHDTYEGYQPSSITGNYMQNLWTNATKTSLSGQTYHYAPDKGHLYYHEGWMTNDTAFYSIFQNRTAAWNQSTGLDHAEDYVSHWNLWRTGGWAQFNPHGNLEVHSSYAYNTFCAYGGVCYSMEGAGSYGQSVLSNAVYHVGGFGGSPEAPGYFSPAKEVVRESTESHFMHHNIDGSDTVVIFNRLNVCGTWTNAAHCDTTRWAARQPRLNERVVAWDYKHRYNWHASEAVTENVGVNFHWTAANGEEVYVYPFINEGWSIGDYDECDQYTNHKSQSPLYFSGPGTASSFCMQAARFVPVTVASVSQGYTSFMQIWHAPGTTTLTEILSDADSRESARGILEQPGSENWMVLFNNTARTTPTPTPNSGSNSANDPRRIIHQKHLRLFKTGFKTTFTVDGNVEIFIADLDPNLAWEYNVNGGSYSSMTVADSGLAEINLTGAGEKILHVRKVLKNSGLNGTFTGISF